MLLNPEWNKTTIELQPQTPAPWRTALLQAAETIREHGHTKHTLRDSRGFCLLGAVMQAVAGHTRFSYSEFETSGIGSQAIERLARYLQAERGAFSWPGASINTVCSWNNQPSTDQGTAVDALVAAASWE